MRIVTSIGPNRIERQQLCISSWLNLGCEVTAIQTIGETAQLKPFFPSVRFKETTQIGDVFNRPHSVRVSALFNEAKENNILILNSDIEVRADKEDFTKRWSTTESNTLNIGIRWDECPNTKQATLLKWGIDAFLITPAIYYELQDIGMTIGCPAWDYWVIIHLYNSCGYEIVTNKQQELFHEIHPKNWSGKEYKIGISLLKKHCGLSEKESAMLIRKVTQR